MINLKKFTKWRPGLAGMFALQAGCVLFLAIEGVYDLFEWEHEHSEPLEAPFVAALVFGTVYSGNELRKMLQRFQRITEQLKVASGAFADVLEDNFEQWNLTPSERDVAIFSIKGLSISDIAQMRDTKEGTIKAQCNALYRKAGVTGRSQLLSHFLEDLMSDDPLSLKKRQAAG